MKLLNASGSPLALLRYARPTVYVAALVVVDDWAVFCLVMAMVDARWLVR